MDFDPQAKAAVDQPVAAEQEQDSQRLHQRWRGLANLRRHESFNRDRRSEVWLIVSTHDLMEILDVHTVDQSEHLPHAEVSRHPRAPRICLWSLRRDRRLGLRRLPRRCCLPGRHSCWDNPCRDNSAAHARPNSLRSSRSRISSWRRAYRHWAYGARHWGPRDKETPAAPFAQRPDYPRAGTARSG